MSAKQLMPFGSIWMLLVEYLAEQLFDSFHCPRKRVYMCIQLCHPGGGELVRTPILIIIIVPCQSRASKRCSNVNLRDLYFM